MVRVHIQQMHGQDPRDRRVEQSYCLLLEHIIVETLREFMLEVFEVCDFAQLATLSEFSHFPEDCDAVGVLLILLELQIHSQSLYKNEL